MKPPLPADLESMEWLTPWEPASAFFAPQLGRPAGAASEFLQKQLAREVGSAPPLFGRRALAVAHRVDRDDVLYWLPDGPGALAQVHLVFPRGDWVDPEGRYPVTRLYSTIEEWTTSVMRPDHAEAERLPYPGWADP